MSQSCDDMQIVIDNSQSFATSKSTVMDCSLEIDEKVANVNRQETIVINRPKVNEMCKNKNELHEKSSENKLKAKPAQTDEKSFKRLWAANQLIKIGTLR
jgi:hypothetical protein